MRLKVRVSDNLQGIIIDEDVEAGTVLVDFDAGPTFTRSQVMEMNPAERKNYFLIGEDSYTPAEDTSTSAVLEFRYSCHPTAVFKRKTFQLIAKNDMVSGDEITLDFGLSETELSFQPKYECICRTPECRGAFTGLEYRSPKFISKNTKYMSSYIYARANALGWVHVGLYGTVESEAGSGLFTAVDIKKGEVVIIWAGKVVTREELREYPQHLQHHTAQISPNLWQAPHLGKKRLEIGDLINHSCEANCGLLDSVTMVAVRDLAAGEQLFIDYATCNNGTSDICADNFDCLCGTPSCRGTVRSSDWLLPQVAKSQYLPPWVRESMKTAV